VAKGSIHNGVWSSPAAAALGKFIEARTYLKSALSSWEPAYREAAPSPMRVHILKMLYRTLICTGHVDQARFCRDEALAEARRISNYDLASMLRHIWYGEWAVGDVKSVPRGRWFSIRGLTGRFARLEPVVDVHIWSQLEATLWSRESPICAG
jgi:hypothetical protein